MALATKYTFSFASVLDGELHTIAIKQEGYGGSPIALPYMVGRDFMVLSYDKGNANLLHPVRGSQLTLRVSLEPSQIQEFVLSDNRTWYIEWTATNGWEWYGWLQPQTSINYNPFGLRELELQFTDNLGALQTSPDNVLDSVFIELQTIGEMITRQLSYTDISLPVTFSTSVRHADEIYDYANDTVYLEQSMALDYLGQQPQMAYDLLTKLCRQLHCTTYQKAGNWVVENWIDKAAAGYPNDILDNYSIVDRSLNVRFESPLSRVTARSYHYSIRHTQQNRSFSDWVPSGPNKGFTFWEQFGTLATEIFDLYQSGGKNYFAVQGNYVSSNANSADYYANDGGAVTAGESVRVFLQWELTPGGAGTVNPRVAINLDASGTPWWLQASGEWTQTAGPVILADETEINGILNFATLAPASGTLIIRIYRPDVPSLGTTYNSGTSYIRFAFADALASKTANETDYKLFKSVGIKDNQGLRPNEKFDTIGLNFDTEFSPNGANFFQYDEYISFLYDSAGNRLDSGFISDYDSTQRGMTIFAANTYMRLFAKPQLYAEVELYGKALNVGDIYTLNIPGLPADLPFVVVAYDWDVQGDRYSALLAYISYDPTDTIGMQRYWLQQNQDDPDD